MINRDFEFENGEPVKEKITGFEGTITGTVYYLTGCNQYLVTAKSKDGKEPVSLWYDEGRLERNNDGTIIKPSTVEAKDNGCDLAPPMGKRGS